MGCGCNKHTSINLKEYTIQQLMKTIPATKCEEEKDIDVYPTTLTQAVFDGCTGKSLQEALNETNHLYVSFKGSIPYTYLSIPQSKRRRGLYVTYTNRKGVLKTKKYEGYSLDDKNWSDDNNWREIDDTNNMNFIPRNLRIEGSKIKLDITNACGGVISTLETELPNTLDKWYKPMNLRVEGNKIKFDVLCHKGILTTHEVELPTQECFRVEHTTKLPQRGNSNTLYLVPNAEAPGTHREFVWVDTLNRYEQLGSASGACSIGGNNTNALVDAKIEGSTITLTKGDTSEIILELPDTSNVEERLIALESRVDADTIYDDTSIKERLSALEEKPDNDTIFNSKPLEDRITALENRPTGSNFDPTPLENRLSALESKQDKDTIFDPSSILQELATLKNKIATLENKEDQNKYIVRGEYLEDESVIRLYYNDNPETHIDIPFKNTEKPTTKYKILTGYKVDPTGDTPRPSEVDLVNTIETSVLPEEIRIDLQQDDYGYYIFAVDKALLPERYKVQLEVMNTFMDVTEDEMEEREVNINGRDYVMFIDNSGNMSFTPIRFKIVQL